MFAHNLQAAVHPREVEVDGLLAEDRLAGARRRLDQLGMGVGGAGDDDRIHRRISKRRLGVDHLRPVGRGQILGRLAVDVDDIAQPGAGIDGDVAGVDPADAPGPELADFDHPTLDGDCLLVGHDRRI